MIYIVLAVCCSVFVSVLLKLAKRYEIDTRQAILWNYSIAAVLTWFFFRPAWPSISNTLYPTYLTLGVLLPSLFLVLALSVRFTGIVRTDIAQRLSLFIPVLSAFVIFGEEFSVMKTVGICVAFLAILSSVRWQKNERTGAYWVYPVIVFVGMGIIDVLFKHIAKTVAIPFTSSLLVVFIFAFVVSAIFLLILFLAKKIKFSLINVLCGWILGIANFGNILFYLKAHQVLAHTPSLVFSGMNIGVIVLGSLVGILAFREKLSWLNYLGIALAMLSIILMALSY